MSIPSAPENIAEPKPDFLVRYLNFEDVDLGALILASEETKWKAVTALGIARPDDPDITPLQAWVDAMLRENGIEPEVPRKPLVHYGVDLGFSETGLRRWIWFVS